VNKKVIIIVIISFAVLTLIIAGGIFWFLNKPVLSEAKCGDGICQTIERQRGICPQDCQPEIETCGPDNKGYCINFREKCRAGYEGIGPDKCKAGRLAQCCVSKTAPIIIDYQDSPFGAHGKLYNDELLSQMCIRWTRLSGLQGLHYSAETQINFENALDSATQNNLQVIVTVKTDTGKYPKDINAYKEFLRNAVDNYKDKVKYYQIENEPAGKHFWYDSPENYAKLLKEAYLTIKEACPECQVVMAGATSGKFSSGDDDFYESVFEALKADPDCRKTGCHDIFDLHTASCDVCLNPNIDCGPDGCSFIKRAFDTARNLQNRYGFVKPIWSTEFGYLRGSLVNTQKSLIKSFVYALDLGYEKLFWRVSEDCCKIWSNNQPTNTYYAYKTLIEKIGGYSALTKIADGQYKFTFSDKNPVYVLWCDSGNCALPLEIKGSVRVTNYLGNEEVMDADQITLTKNPVFVEIK
jgi:hypothetical protein